MVENSKKRNKVQLCSTSTVFLPVTGIGKDESNYTYLQFSIMFES